MANKFKSILSDENNHITHGGLRIVGNNESTDQQTAWIRSNGNYIVINPVDGEHLYLNWDTGQSGGSGQVYVVNNVYAQAFYDRGDTNYQLNPAGSSVINTITTGAITANGDIIANTHVYGRSQNNASSKLYRFGGLYLTWDSDSYGTAFEHSLTSSYGGTFTDSITLNSYNHIRFNIDSNNNNGTSYFEVGDGTTGTGNVIFRLSQDGNVNIYGTTTLPEANSQIKIGTFTDGSSNSGIYDDDDILIGDGGSISIFPHRRGDYGLNATTATSTTFRSKLNIWSDNEDHITFGGASTHMVSAWENWKIWINNDSANDGHLQLYNKSTKVEFARLSGGGTNSFILGTFKATGDLRAPIFYDSDNTNFYLNPAGLSLLNETRIGTTGSDYTYTLRLEAADKSSIGFHDSGSTIGAITFSGSEGFRLGANQGSYGPHGVSAMDRFYVAKEVTDTDGQSIKGYRLNKATSSSWTEGGTGNQTGWYGGNFGGSEITTKWVDGPHGERTLAAETTGDTGNDYDGGFVKPINNLDINKSHLSIVYIRRISSDAAGSVYHGTGAGANQITDLSGNSNTNPYFHYPALSSFPQNVWCVSIGVIQANNDDNTTNKTGSNDLQGIYRCDTGQKIINSSTTWKMGSAGSTLNNGIRFFHYYSTNANAKLQWAKPGFYEINGDEPSLAEILTGGNRGLHTNGGDLTAPIFYDYDNTSYFVNPAGTSLMNDIELDDYIVHKGDTDTYFGFNGADSWKLRVGGGDRLIVSSSVITSNLTLDLGSGGASIKKSAGGTNGNHAAIELYSSGTADSGSAIAIQQQSSEGDSIIFADYEPHVEWGISTENSNNEIQFTAGNTTGTMGSKTLYNNAGSARTAYKKMIFVLGTGVMSVGGDVRAPIFYDLGNTAYYTNPAGLSQMHTIDFDGAVSGSNTGAAQIGRNHAYDTLELKGYGAEMMIGSQHTTLHINYRTCNNNTSGHTPTTWYWRAGASNNWSTHNFGNVTSNGILTATTDVRAPSFADSNDTTYYLNPAGTGTSLNIKGKIQQFCTDGNIFLGINHSGNENWEFKCESASGTTDFISIGANGGDKVKIYEDGKFEHKGLQTLSDGTSIDQVKEYSMTFQLTGNTWTDTGIDGTDLTTGTYAMQVLVDDYSVAGQHYSEYYSGIVSWYSASTNSTNVDEIIVHRAGHASNAGDVQFRTQRALGTDSHDLMLQVKHNLSYNAALDGTTAGKKMIFKFRRLI